MARYQNVNQNDDDIELGQSQTIATDDESDHSRTDSSEEISQFQYDNNNNNNNDLTPPQHQHYKPKSNILLQIESKSPEHDQYDNQNNYNNSQSLLHNHNDNDNDNDDDDNTNTITVDKYNPHNIQQLTPFKKNTNYYGNHSTADKLLLNKKSNNNNHNSYNNNTKILDDFRDYKTELKKHYLSSLLLKFYEEKHDKTFPIYTDKLYCEYLYQTLIILMMIQIVLIWYYQQIYPGSTIEWNNNLYIMIVFNTMLFLLLCLSFGKFWRNHNYSKSKCNRLYVFVFNDTSSTSFTISIGITLLYLILIYAVIGDMTTDRFLIYFVCTLGLNSSFGYINIGHYIVMAIIVFVDYNLCVLLRYFKVNTIGDTVDNQDQREASLEYIQYEGDISTSEVIFGNIIIGITLFYVGYYIYRMQQRTAFEYIEALRISKQLSIPNSIMKILDNYDMDGYSNGYKSYNNGSNVQMTKQKNGKNGKNGYNHNVNGENVQLNNDNNNNNINNNADNADISSSESDEENTISALPPLQQRIDGYLQHEEELQNQSSSSYNIPGNNSDADTNNELATPLNYSQSSSLLNPLNPTATSKPQINIPTNGNINNNMISLNENDDEDDDIHPSDNEQDEYDLSNNRNHTYNLSNTIYNSSYNLDNNNNNNNGNDNIDLDIDSSSVSTSVELSYSVDIKQLNKFNIISLISTCKYLARKAATAIIDIYDSIEMNDNIKYDCIKTFESINKSWINRHRNDKNNAHNNGISPFTQQLPSFIRDTELYKMNPRAAAYSMSNGIITNAIKHNFPSISVKSSSSIKPLNNDTISEYIDIENCKKSKLLDEDQQDIQSLIPQRYYNKFAHLSEDEIVLWIEPLDGIQKMKKNDKETRRCVTILIGIADNDTKQPLGGIIYSPWTNESIVGIPDIGYWIYNFTILNLNKSSNLKLKRIIVNEYNYNEQIKKYINTIKSASGNSGNNKIKLIYGGGNGNNILRLLENECDVFINIPHNNNLYKWHTCAIEAIISSINGNFTQINGKKYEYKDTTLKHKKGFIATLYGGKYHQQFQYTLSF